MWKRRNGERIRARARPRLFRTKGKENKVKPARDDTLSSQEIPLENVAVSVKKNFDNHVSRGLRYLLLYRRITPRNTRVAYFFFFLSRCEGSRAALSRLSNLFVQSNSNPTVPDSPPPRRRQQVLHDRSFSRYARNTRARVTLTRGARLAMDTLYVRQTCARVHTRIVKSGRRGGGKKYVCVYVDAANRYTTLLQRVYMAHLHVLSRGGFSSVGCTTMRDNFISGAPALPTTSAREV